MGRWASRLMAREHVHNNDGLCPTRFSLTCAYPRCSSSSSCSPHQRPRCSINGGHWRFQTGRTSSGGWGGEGQGGGVWKAGVSRHVPPAVQLEPVRASPGKSGPVRQKFFFLFFLFLGFWPICFFYWVSTFWLVVFFGSFGASPGKSGPVRKDFLFFFWFLVFGLFFSLIGSTCFDWFGFFVFIRFILAWRGKNFNIDFHLE